MDSRTPIVTNNPNCVSEVLVAFLYLLMRDEVVPGAVQKLYNDAQKAFVDSPVSFSNKHLESYSRELAGGLMKWEE